MVAGCLALRACARPGCCHGAAKWGHFLARQTTQTPRGARSEGPKAACPAFQEPPACLEGRGEVPHVAYPSGEPPLEQQHGLMHAVGGTLVQLSRCRHLAPRELRG